jgi:four helix bundle protein
MKQLDSFDAYRVAQELAETAYALTITQPLTKHFALIDQIRRACISAPANIAEGYALGTTRQLIRCLRIALGSTAELRSHLDIAKRLKLADETELNRTIALAMRVISILIGLLRKLSGKAAPSMEVRRQNRGSSS